LPENIRTGTVSADITCTSVMAHTHVQLHCVAIYTPRGMGHAISIPRGMGYLSRPGYVRGGSARCTGRNSKFCYPEVLPTTNRLYRSGFIDLGPVVSELYGFENVNTAGMDGQTHGRTDARRAFNRFYKSSANTCLCFVYTGETIKTGFLLHFNLQRVWPLTNNFGKNNNQLNLHLITHTFHETWQKKQETSYNYKNSSYNMH